MKRTKYHQAYYQRNKERFLARKKVRYQIKKGNLILGPCSVCGSKDSKPWFTSSTDLSEFEPYCDPCRKKEEKEIDDTYEEIIARAEEDDKNRRFGGQSWTNKK